MANAPTRKVQAGDEAVADDINVNVDAIIELQAEVNAIETETPAQWAQQGSTAQIPSNKLGNVPSRDLRDGEVGTNQIADEAVIARKLGANAVTRGKLADAAVTTDKIENNAVTNRKIAADSISRGEMQDGSVGSSELTDGAVINRTIGAGSVSEDKLAAAVRTKLNAQGSSAFDDTALKNQVIFSLYGGGITNGTAAAGTYYLDVQSNTGAFSTANILFASLEGSPVINNSYDPSDTQRYYQFEISEQLANNLTS